MLVLGIETSTVQGGVAVARSQSVLASRTHRVPNAHGEQLLRLLEHVLDDAGIERSELQLIAVGVGPGSFTGLRVGIALGLGLSLGLGIPIVGVSSLRSLANSARPPGVRGAVIDARRGEAFAAAYAEDGSELLSPCALPKATAVETLTSEFRARSVAGSEALELPLDKLPDSAFPTAAQVAKLGQLTDFATTPEPIYVRAADAVVPRMPPSPLAGGAG